MLTGRYQFKPTLFGRLVLVVEDHVRGRYEWRRGRTSDLKSLEPAVADGWRFPEERNGILGFDGKRYDQGYADALGEVISHLEESPQ